jgi:glycine/D-amino acid oxidase-like deaminating enzyme
MAHVVIVGSSIGGVRTAPALRREGFAGDVTIIGAEPYLPYDKPTNHRFRSNSSAAPGISSA